MWTDPDLYIFKPMFNKWLIEPIVAFRKIWMDKAQKYIHYAYLKTTLIR